MKSRMMMVALLAVVLLAPYAANAAGPFDGTWKTKLDSIQISGRPNAYELKDAVFKCVSCAPPYTVKADGTDQKVSGHSYYDTVAVKIVDARTVELTNKLAGRTIYEDTMTVSPDGKTLSEAFKDMSGAKAATFSQSLTRVGAGTASSHAVAGSWKIDRVPDASDSGTTVTYRMTADGMQMNYNGQTYDAKFDGKPVLTANDPGKTWVSLKRISETVIEETDTRDGKVTDITRMTIANDGKSMAVVDKDQLRDTTVTYTMNKEH
jgi:hypothetical protein